MPSALAMKLNYRVYTSRGCSGDCARAAFVCAYSVFYVWLNWVSVYDFLFAIYSDSMQALTKLLGRICCGFFSSKGDFCEEQARAVNGDTHIYMQWRQRVRSDDDDDVSNNRFSLLIHHITCLCVCVWVWVWCALVEHEYINCHKFNSFGWVCIQLGWSGQRKAITE